MLERSLKRAMVVAGGSRRGQGVICVRQVKVHEVDRGTGECSGRVLAGECSRASALRGRESARAYVEAKGKHFVFTQRTPTRPLQYKCNAFSNLAFRIQWNLSRPS